MAYLIDTSILVRLTNRADASYPVADRAVTELHRRGEVLHLTPQNLIEFRNVATRPASLNGLGLPVEAVEIKAADFEAIFPVLPETPDIYPAWKTLAGASGVLGKQAFSGCFPAPDGVVLCKVHHHPHRGCCHGTAQPSAKVFFNQ